jgi:hypothetical protein
MTTTVSHDDRKNGGPPKRRTRRQPKLSDVKAKCLDCLGGKKYDCESKGCPLYFFRPWPGRPAPKR